MPKINFSENSEVILVAPHVAYMRFLKLLLEVLGPAGAAAIGGALLIISVEAVRWMWG